MGEAKRKKDKKQQSGDELEQELEDTFPASDALTSTEPGGGITANEPPPKRAGAPR